MIVGAVTGRGPTQDSPEFTPAMRQAAGVLRLDTVLADAGYDAEHNHRLCREALRVRRTVINLNPRNTGRRWPATPYRREMRRRFPRALYRQRWHAESAFSRHKRQLGSALTARRTASQQRELVLRVLTHNLMLLKRARSGFQQSTSGSEQDRQHMPCTPSARVEPVGDHPGQVRVIPFQGSHEPRLGLEPRDQPVREIAHPSFAIPATDTSPRG